MWGACRTVSFEHVPKAIIMRRTEGMIKMVIHPQPPLHPQAHHALPGELSYLFFKYFVRGTVRKAYHGSTVNPLEDSSNLLV